MGPMVVPHNPAKLRIVKTNMIRLCRGLEQAKSPSRKHLHVLDCSHSQRISMSTEFLKKLKGRNLTHASRRFRIAVIVSAKNSGSTAVHRQAIPSDRPN